MLGHMVLLAAMIGQTTHESWKPVPPLSKETKKAQARAMAELKVNQEISKPKIIAQHQLENERLKRRIHVGNVAPDRIWSLTAGTSTSGDAIRVDGFASVPPSSPANSPGSQHPSSLEELRREKCLLYGELHDSQRLYREANRFYRAEYPIRYRRAFWGMR
jgi:hypothetical protein